MPSRRIFVGDVQLSFTSENVGEVAGETEPEIITKADIQRVIAKAQDMGSGVLHIVGSPLKSIDRISKLLTFIQAAGGAVLDRGGRLLMIRRFGKMDLPKGKLEEGESLEECAMREVEEECGVSGLMITNTLEPTYHMYQMNGEWVLKKSNWFKMLCSDGKNPTPQKEEGIEEVMWMSAIELDIDKIDTYPSIRLLLRQL